MIVAYPMVEEDEATGRVAAVYAAALEQAPFVPSLLKSLAVCPPYAVLAWEQGAAVLASADAAETVERLAASVTDAAAPPADPRDRRLLAGFVEPLGRMLLLSCGLLAALEGALPGRPSARGAAPRRRRSRCARASRPPALSPRTPTSWAASVPRSTRRSSTPSGAAQPRRDASRRSGTSSSPRRRRPERARARCTMRPRRPPRTCRGRSSPTRPPCARPASRTRRRRCARSCGRTP